MKGKVYSYISHYREEFKFDNKVVENINTIIRGFNDFCSLSEEDINYRKQVELGYELEVRGYSKDTPYEEVDFCFIYWNDGNNLIMLQNGNFKMLLENPFTVDTIHYLCSIEGYLEQKPELVKNISALLHFAQKKYPEKIEMTKKQKRAYQKPIKREIKYMKKLGLYPETK